MNNKPTADSPVNFSGGIAEHYDDFLGPMFFEPYAIEVARRIEPAGISVALEIASGTGRVTRHLRQRIPANAKLIASDISEEMLSVAREKLHHADIQWQMIDAQQLPFDDNSIDLVVCCFGYMFVPDKTKAFAEVFRVLRPGGLFLYTTWDLLERNGASYTARTIAKKYLDDPLPPAYNLATSMHNENLNRSLLTEAGFSTITIERVEQLSVSPTAKVATTGLVNGGLVFEEIRKRNPAWIDEIKITVEKELSEKYGAGPMIAPMSALISRAWK